MCLALAGAGSGKTHTLVLRIQNLIQQYEVAPEHILVITFTKAAATELMERFENLMGRKDTSVVFGTFHSVFYRILQENYHFKKENILLEYQKEELLRNALSMSQVELEEDNKLYKKLLKEISYVKNTMIPIEEYQSQVLSGEAWILMFQAYERVKKSVHKIDFDDMMMLTYEMLVNEKELLKYWQKRFTFLLIDEIQDMNLLQFHIIQLLAQPENNLFVVGDDDQSIYGFRGANPGLMMSFPKLYPQCQQIILNKNYRCSQKITMASEKLISHNQCRFQKHMVSERNDEGIVASLGFENHEKEYEAVICQIKKMKKENLALEEMAVLYRTNAQALGLVENFVREKIPFYMKDRIENIYRHWIVQDLMSYLRLIIGEAKRGDFLRISNRPLRYISRESIDAKEMSLEHWRQFYENQPYMRKRIETLVSQVHLMKKMSTFATINYIRKGIGYDEFLTTYAREHHQKVEKFFEVADMVLEGAKEFYDKKKFIKHMEQMKEVLDASYCRQSSQKATGVGFYTLHGAKGLEFKMVIIIDVNEGSVPSKKAKEEKELEEERRMFYVGITRAKEILYLYYVLQQDKEVRYPSRFIKEMGIETKEIRES